MSNALERLVRNWWIKAGNDLKIGQDEMQTPEPTTDMICFYMPTHEEAESSIQIALAVRGFVVL